MIFLLLFSILLFKSVYCSNPEISKNLKMVVVYGKPSRPTSTGRFEKPWPDCATECLKIWDCVAVQDDCFYYSMQHITFVVRLAEEDGVKIALKINLETCPDLNETPPLFGKDSRSIIVTDNTNFYQSELMDIQLVTFWKYNHTIYKCMTEIPENYVTLEGTNLPKPYVYELQAPFTTGDTFFLKGRTLENRSFSITFSAPDDNISPLYVVVLNGQLSQYCNQEDGLTLIDTHCILASTWNNEVMQHVASWPNPYGNNQEFEIRINSTETKANIYLNDKLIQFDLTPDVPLSLTKQFVINVENIEEHDVVLYFIDWSGHCWFEPFVVGGPIQ